jgi:hypothetical protein
MIPMTVTSLRILFFTLQMADILLTLLAVRLGGVLVGPFIGVVSVKLAMVLVTFAMQAERLISAGNIAYLGMLAWDGYIIHSLSRT